MTLMLFRHTIISANKNQCSSRKEMLFHKCACVLQPRGVGGSLRIEMCFSTSLLQFYSTAKCPPIYPVILLCMSLILECTLSRQKSETINGKVFCQSLAQGCNIIFTPKFNEYIFRRLVTTLFHHKAWSPDRNHFKPSIFPI